jgi:hypothetical protein
MDMVMESLVKWLMERSSPEEMTVMEVMRGSSLSVGDDTP